MKVKILLLLLVCLSFPSLAQPWQLIKSISHKGIDNLALDHVGNMYVTDERGTVTKYDKNGQLFLEYSPLQMARVYELAITSQLKLTLFYRDLQELIILDRYLASPVRYRLSDFDLGFVEQVALNLQQVLWVLDISDFSMKMIDVRENRLLEEKSLAQVLNQNQAEILSFHAHQNRMYLVDKASGIQVFDNIGNYLSKLIDSGPLEIGFDKDYLYYRNDNYLKFIHLYQGEDKRLELPSGNFSKIRYSNGQLVVFTPLGFDIYKYLSEK